MRHFPAFVSLHDRRAVVVGGGEAACRRVALLRSAGAEVTVVAPTLGEALAASVERGEANWAARAFAPSDLDGAALAIAATGEALGDRAVANAARARGIPVNVVDNAALSTFIVPAIIDRDPLVIAVSSGGAAPTLAQALKAAIEAAVPAGIGRLARFAEAFRAAVKNAMPERRARLAFWQGFWHGPIAARFLRGDETGAREAMLAYANRRIAPPEGAVAIVGAGPGDPELLTLRAHRLLGQADVVVYDRLVGADILALVRRDAERIYVGKARSAHTLDQDAINELLAARAAAGLRVVRLKGGDPFIFGRGGEELGYLEARGIAVEVVPGITAATAAAACAGIPLTHRSTAQAVTLVTAQGRDGPAAIDWGALARLKQTIVVYMGVSEAGNVARKLVAGGLAAATPAAIVENATRPDQRTVRTTLGRLGAAVAAHAVAGPAVLVIGEVAGLSAAADPVPLRAVG
jgi:uroporphyrin-III C-methyltransferase/precorrin-2 dehydrogenase/sirohydrochlorin ferrochelatase